jgi:hypothetical protein
MNRTRQKWLDLQAWENKYKSIAVFTSEIAEVRKQFEVEDSISDSQLAEAMTDVLHFYDEELDELEDRIVLSALNYLGK